MITFNQVHDIMRLAAPRSGRRVDSTATSLLVVRMDDVIRAITKRAWELLAKENEKRAIQGLKSLHKLKECHIRAAIDEHIKL